MASLDDSSVSLPLIAPKGPEKPEKQATAGSADQSKATKASKEKDEDGLSVEDLAMPRAMISRLTKAALPSSSQVQKDALLAITKSATLFINHIASSAQTNLPPNKKTIQPANVFAALEETEFAFMLPALKGELEMFNSLQTAKRERYKEKVGSKDKATTGALDESTMLAGDEDSRLDGLGTARGVADPGAQLEAESQIDRQRSAKRVKGDDGGVLPSADEDEDGYVDMLGAEGEEQTEGDDSAESDVEATDSDSSAAEEDPEAGIDRIENAAEPDSEQTEDDDSD